MGAGNLIVEKRGRIVCVTINRPERLNAFDAVTTAEFVKLFEAYRDDPEQWCMIITGAGDKAFSTGMDVQDRAKKSAVEKGPAHVTGWKPAADVMQSIHKPFISAVNGYCVGGGWHLVADSDIVIASENAAFFDTHVNIGFISGVESAGLAWKLPLTVVMRMVMEGKRFRVTAQQAYMWGLVSEVVPPQQLMPRAWEIAQHIVEETAPLAVQGSKKAILGALDRGIHGGIAYAWTVLPEVANTEDLREGPRAFVEKRKPRFQGR